MPLSRCLAELSSAMHVASRQPAGASVHVLCPKNRREGWHHQERLSRPRASGLRPRLAWAHVS
jgi:hypothetical protein